MKEKKYIVVVRPDETAFLMDAGTTTDEIANKLHDAVNGYLEMLPLPSRVCELFGKVYKVDGFIDDESALRDDSPTNRILTRLYYEATGKLCPVYGTGAFAKRSDNGVDDEGFTREEAVALIRTMGTCEFKGEI